MIHRTTAVLEEAADNYVDNELVGAHVDEEVTHQAFIAGVRWAEANPIPVLYKAIENLQHAVSSAQMSIRTSYLFTAAAEVCKIQYPPPPVEIRVTPEWVEQAMKRVGCFTETGHALLLRELTKEQK